MGRFDCNIFALTILYAVNIIPIPHTYTIYPIHICTVFFTGKGTKSMDASFYC